MGDWGSKGCDACRQGVLIGHWPPPARIAAADGPIFLHRCDVCGTYWKLNLREGHVIDEAEARYEFPNAFDSPGQGRIVTKRDIEHALEELILLLESAHENTWAASLRRLQSRMRSSTSEPTAYQQVLRDLLSTFGGMGSFSDLVLYRNGVPLRTENDRFAQLRGQLFVAARDELI